MPVVIPAGASSSSTVQSVPGQSVFDYILDDTGAAVPNAKVTAVLNGDFITSISPQVTVQPTQVSTTTDGNGFWQLSLIPNTNLSPANTTYTIQTPFRSYDIQVGPSGPYQSTSVGTLVNIPTTLGPATSSVIGGLTVSAGLIVSAGGATISGGLTIASGTLSLSGASLSMAGPLTLTAAASQIVPGATSLSVRNNANAADNLLVTDAGLVTARAGLVATAGGVTATAGDVAITAGNLTMGAAASRLVPGATSFSVRDTANANDNLLVSNAGMVTARAGLTVTTGGITVTAGGEVITAGDLTVTAGRIVMAAAASKIVPGATSLSLRNNADNAANLSLTDAGLTTLRNGLLLPAAAAGALAANSAYATVPIKIDDQLLAAPAASITFINPLPTNFRHLLLEWYARSDQAIAAATILLRFNNVSTATYDFTYVRGSNNAASSAYTAGQTSIQIGVLPGSTATAAYFGQGQCKVLHYQGTTGNKLAVAESFMMSSDVAGGDFNDHTSGKWRTTATAVTRIDLLPGAGANFIAGSVFTLWGIP